MAKGFLKRLAGGEFVITAEITPPLSVDPDAVAEKVRPLKGLADGVNVTDGAAARVGMDPVAAGALLIRHGVEPIVQLTCRDRNRIALQGSIIGAAALGVRAFLLLRGDDPTQGDQPDAKPVFDLQSNELVATAASIASGRIPGGSEIGGQPNFLIGVADAPIDPPADWRPDSLLAKIAAGAQFAQTQFCMDAGVVERYVNRLRSEGVPESFKLIVGVAPLASVRSARWIIENLRGSVIPNRILDRLEAAADAAIEGRAICVEMIEALSMIEGVAGAHVMAPLNEKALPEVLAAARRAVSKRG